MNARTGREAPQTTTAHPTAPASGPTRLSGDDVQAAIIVQIKAELGALDWNQRDLSASAGVPTTTLHRYLAGTRDIPLPVVVEIARALGLTLGELMTRAQIRFDAS